MSDIVAKLADGTELRFPASTPDDVVNNAVKNYLAEPANQVTAAPNVQAPVTPTGPEGAPIPPILQTQEKPKIETANPLEAFIGSTKRMGSDIVTGAQLPFDANKATIEGMARQEGITEKSATSLEAVKQAYENDGIIPAAKEVATQFPSFIAEQAPLVGSMYAGAKAGAMLPVPPMLKPYTAIAGSILLPILAYSGSSAERKAGEQISKGEKVDIDAAGAFASGTAQAALDRLSLGLSGLSKLFGISYKQLGTEAAEKIAKESIGTALVKGTLKTEALEMPTEIAQQAIERYYAGLSLTDADALKEYGEIAYATSLMGPLGGAARLQERSQAKKATTPTPPPISERIEPEVTPREPVVEVGQPTIVPSPEIEAYDKEIAKAQPAPVEPVTEPTKIDTSHDTQAMLDELAGKDIEYIPEEEAKPTEIPKEQISNAKQLTKTLGGENAQQLKDDFNPTYNYTNKDGVEVTFKEDGKVFNLVPGDEDTQVGSDIHLDYIGSKDRNKGLASKELDRIINMADDNNLSISLEVDKQDKNGLSNDQLKDWYQRKGFVFPRGNDIGYRPRPDESLLGYPEKTIQVPEDKIQDAGQQINSDLTKRTFSDEETFYEMFNNGSLKEGYQAVPTESAPKGYDEVYYYDGKNKPVRVSDVYARYDAENKKVVIDRLAAEPTGVISETEKEFTPVGGRLINKADAARLARESAIALEQNLKNQEIQRDKQIRREIREDKFPAAKTPSLASALKALGGIKQSNKLDMIGDTGKVFNYESAFSEDGEDLLTHIENGDLDQYLPYQIRLSNTPENEPFDPRPGYEYISKVIESKQKAYDYDYELAKIDHENKIREKYLAKEYMEPNEEAQAAAAELQGKEYMNVEIPIPKVTEQELLAQFSAQAQEYISEMPIFESAKETKSFKIEMNKLRRAIKKGMVSEADVIPAIDQIYESTQKDYEPSERIRGAEIIKEKLLAAKRRKELSPEIVDMALFLIDKNPALVKDLAVSITASKRDGRAGGYAPLARLATIFKYTPNNETAVHEILHHLERMMPKDIQASIRKAWSRSLSTSAARAFGGTNETLKQYYRDVIDYHTNGDEKAQKRAMSLLAANTVGYDHYQNFNPSEFWAINGSSIVQNRYNADISESMVERIKNWLLEFVEKVKALFNLQSDAAVIRALNSVAKGDGKFITDMIHTDSDTFNIQQSKTDTPEFKKWFGNSKVVNPDGTPRVMYHGTKQDLDEFKSAYQITKEKDSRYGAYGLAGIYFTPDPSFASAYARSDFRKRKQQANVLPVYLRMEKPYFYPEGKWAQVKAAFLNPIERFKLNREVTKNIREKGFPDLANIKSMQINKEGYRFVRIQEVNKLKAKGYDGIISPNGQMFIVFDGNQVKSAIGNKGTYNPESNKIYENIQRPPRNFRGQEVLPQWHGPEESKMDDLIYLIQNKQIDTKRVQEAIGDIEENWNVYEKEQLYHGRTASGIRNFLLKELLPVIKEIERLKISPEDIRAYLHNRHAEERNIQMNKINPDIYDPKTGRTTPNPLKDKGSGISTADAQAYLNNLDPAKKQVFEQIATKFDEMVKGTQQILINSGNESAETIAKWNKTYKHYVPLFRVEDEMARPSGMGGTGQGFGTRGNFSKRAMGSEKDVQDILSNIIAQRERALIRAEKTRVGRALYGMAIQNANPDFWLPINPDAIRNKKQAIAELTRMGIPDAENVVNNLMAEPKERYLRKINVAEGAVEPDEDFDFDSGLPVNESKEVVASKINVMARYKDFVFPVRINGKDRYIFFNKNDPRALRMVQSLKNLDVENLGLALSIAGKFTRWFKNVNTQYNPVFGLVNFVRDFSGALLNLTSTEIKGEQAKVIAGAYKAMGGILNVHRAERKGKPLPTGPWAKLYQEARAEGFQTGYRDSLIRNQEEMQIVENTLNQFKDGNTKKAFYAVIGGLTDFNDMMENAIRLSAYKVALDKGLSKQKAAIIAKNLTVNFDKKGAKTAQVNALYAFFNASVQGTERIYQTIKGPKGKMIIGGGILAGMVQAVMLAGAGYDDDDPPEFVREKNFIIPLVDGTYLTVPYPLGYNVLPNSGRIVMDFMLHGGRNPGKHAVNFLSSVVNSFNPLGSTGFSMQTIMPTVLDPLAALSENKDAFGRPISRKDRATAPTPGYTRSRETSTKISQGLAYFLNLASGGSKYQKGYISPTADELDFLAGQIGGGLYREVTKAGKAVSSVFTGEEIPTYQRPVVGRFVGATGSQASVAQSFYNNVTRMTDHENEIKGRMKNREDVEGYLKDYPEARLWKRANSVENKINELNKRKRLFVERGFPKERIQAIDAQKTLLMQRFNDQVKNLRPD